MTYCIGILVREGLVLMADTRTNAGVDNISSYRKLRVMEHGPDRVIMCASAGSLSVTQSALSRVALGVVMPDTGEKETLDGAPTVFRAAQIVGQALSDAKTEIDRVVKDAQVVHRCLTAARRQHRRAAAASVPDLWRRQFHRMPVRHALPADWRDQIWQAGARSHAHL